MVEVSTQPQDWQPSQLQDATMLLDWSLRHGLTQETIASVSKFLYWSSSAGLVPSQAMYIWFHYHPQSLAGFKFFNRVGGGELFVFLASDQGQAWLRGKTGDVDHLKDFFAYLISVK